MPPIPQYPPFGRFPLPTRPLRHAAVRCVCFLVATAIALPISAQATSVAPAPARKASGAPAAKSAPAKVEPRQAMVIAGDDHLFMVSAPEGWVLDDTSGMGSRIRCVFYPKGQSWSTAPTVMYVNPLHGFGAKTRTMSTLMSEDQKSFLKRSPRGRVSDAGTIATSGKKTAQLRYFADSGAAPHEAVAYVPESDLVMLIVLSSRTPQGFQQALPAYRALVETYAWVGSNQEFGRR